MINKELAKKITYMTAIGDALGVPVEFNNRAVLFMNPVTGYREQGTHWQPAGTWSDDTAFFLANLTGIYKIDDTAEQDRDEVMYDLFAECTNGRFWPDGILFDIGKTTKRSIENRKGESSETSSGNGALMRAMPLFMYLYEPDKEYSKEDIDFILWNTSLTHDTEMARMVNVFYLELARRIFEYPEKSYDVLVGETKDYCSRAFENGLLHACGEMLEIIQTIEALPYMKRSDIKSGGYCLDTLTAAVHCLLQPGSAKERLLMAVNLGDDTDTTASVLGGLLGIREELPEDLLEGLRSKEIIEDIIDSL